LSTFCIYVSEPVKTVNIVLKAVIVTTNYQS